MLVRAGWQQLFGSCWEWASGSSLDSDREGASYEKLFCERSRESFVRDVSARRCAGFGFKQVSKYMVPWKYQFIFYNNRNHVRPIQNHKTLVSPQWFILGQWLDFSNFWVWGTFPSKFPVSRQVQWRRAVNCQPRSRAKSSSTELLHPHPHKFS